MEKIRSSRMIRHYEQEDAVQAELGQRFQLGAALGAGLIAGGILLLVPRGSPWAGVTFFSYVIMGRALPASSGMPLPVLCLIHLAVAELYALIISALISRVTQGRAILAGAILGLGLYVMNFSIVSSIWPAWRGNEISVAFTHVVFGLIAAGAYRGLLRRKVAVSQPN